MAEKSPSWRRLTVWPSDPISFLGLPSGAVDFCKTLFEDRRLRFEVLRYDGEAEARIPCRHGSELFPVGPDRWGWIGPGGTWTIKVLAVLGRDGRNSLGGIVDPGTKHDESQIHFPAARLLDVAKAVGARKRGRGNPNPRPLPGARINSEASGIHIPAPA